jgi:hypothetical protein
MSRRVVVALILGMVVPAAATAQETRAARLERQRAEKATRLEPYKPGRLEKLLSLDEESILAKIAPHNGFFVEYGYEYKPTGSGIGLGGGYRHDLFDRTARVVLQGGITYKRYSLLRADFSLPYLADERFEVGVEALYHYHPQEDFYGLGPDSLEANRVSFKFDGPEYRGRAIVRPRRWLEAGAIVGRMSPDIGRGKDSQFPSIEDIFEDAAAPGLLQQPDFTYGQVFAAIDYRDQRNNARSGGYYAVEWRQVGDGGANRHGFRLFDATLQQFFPVFDKKRVFAFQASLIAATPDEGETVPFYFKPTLGGGHSVRSLPDFRFRDDAVMFINAEYRWEAFSILDMALFADWGQVAAEVGDLDFGDLKRGYGIGFRFNTASTVFMRFDIAGGGGEGVRYLFKFSKMF